MKSRRYPARAQPGNDIDSYTAGAPLEIRNFDDLLRAARAESQRQRMLFVFVGSVTQADDIPQLVAEAKEFSDD